RRVGHGAPGAPRRGAPAGPVGATGAMGTDDTTQMEHETTQVMSRTGEFSTTLGWEASTRNRLAAAIDRFSGPLADLVERDANDGDTRLLVTDFLSYGLNFSKYEELTTEYRTSGDSIDYALRLD